MILHKLQCQLTAVPMRAEPSDKAEMVNQMLYGEIATVLTENEKWCMVKLDHDQYQGWVDKKQLSKTVDNGLTNLVTALYQLADTRIVACGSYISDLSVTQPTNISTIAKQFLSAPYLWGGRTFMGIDCSGFTQVVYRACGQSLLRDAHQQAESGQTITFTDEAQTGDLAFFDNTEGRITHVGIILDKNLEGQHTIIHASGRVRIDVLDHQGIYNAETKSYSHNLRLIKRL